MSRREWTDEEVAYIKENLTKNNEELGIALNRTAASVMNKKKYLKLINPECRWSKQEDAVIIEFYCNHGAARVAQMLNMSVSAVHGRAEKLGVRAKVRTDFQPGSRFGRLVVIEKYSKPKRCADGRLRSVYLCQCDCGRKKKVARSCLTSGTQSCGCYKVERIQEAKRKPRGFMSNKRKFDICWGGAKGRGIPFELTLGQHIEISSKNCFYCDEEPPLWNPYCDKDNKKKHLGGTVLDSTVDLSWIRANGIDRKDNDHSIGYTLENSVPCCKTCNFMKVVLEEQEFLKHVEKISRYQNSKNKINSD